MIRRSIATLVFSLALAAGCGASPLPAEMGDTVSARKSPLTVNCAGNWSLNVGTVNTTTGQGNGYCFGQFEDEATSEWLPSTERIVGVVSNAAPLHVWLCDHTRGGGNGGVPQPWPFYTPGFVNQTTGHCWRTDGVNNTFYRGIGPTTIASMLVTSSWTQPAPACTPPTANDTYTDCGSLSDSGLPNVIARRFGAVIAGTWPDGSSGAPCTGQRVLPPGDQYQLSTFVGSACPAN